MELICKDCGCQYEKWLPPAGIENNRCRPCNEAGWKKWEEAEADNLKQIEELQKQGHSEHCAYRQIWGDGACECHNGLQSGAGATSEGLNPKERA